MPPKDTRTQLGWLRRRTTRSAPAASWRAVPEADTAAAASICLPASLRLTDEVAHLGVAVLLGHLVQRAQLLEVELLQGQGQLECVQGVA